MIVGAKSQHCPSVGANLLIFDREHRSRGPRNYFDDGLEHFV